MKAIILCVLLSLFVAGAFAAIDGIFQDSRFGGNAYICTAGDNGLQGTASAKVFFHAPSYVDGDTTFSGYYYEAGPRPRHGTFALWATSDGFSYEGFYWPSDDQVHKRYRGWPWVLTRTSSSIPSKYQCLYANNVTDPPTINSQWSYSDSANSWTNYFCKDAYGTEYNSTNQVVGFYDGEVSKDGSVFAGRHYAVDPTSDDLRSCSEYGNALLRVIDNGDNFQIAGFIHHANIVSPPYFSPVIGDFVSADVDTTTCRAGAELSSRCETGEVGGPIMKPKRAAASGLLASAFAIIAMALVALVF